MSAERPARGPRTRALRIAGWNAALILGGLALIAAAGEAWLRLTDPLVTSAARSRFVPGVGLLHEPHAEVRTRSRHGEFATVARANSLGFLDREPPDPARAAASCHVAVIGDSFIAAREVAIADKVQVRLEALAAAVLPELDVTTSGWGRGGIGQANQLPFYDKYVRGLRPNLVVLPFVYNDFTENSPTQMALWEPGKPDTLAFLERTADGAVRLRPPDPGSAEYARQLWGGEEPRGAVRALTERSLFARWLEDKLRHRFWTAPPPPPIQERAAALAAQPGYGWILDGWDTRADAAAGDLGGRSRYEWILSDSPPPLFAEALEFTALALAEFRARAERDGYALVILPVHHMGGEAGRASAVLRGMAAPLGIPVINQYDWIVNTGGRVADASFPHDRHWTPQGHQWAAEALLDWLRRHPEVCEDAA